MPCQYWFSRSTSSLSIVVVVIFNPPEWSSPSSQNVCPPQKRLLPAQELLRRSRPVGIPTRTPRQWTAERRLVDLAPSPHFSAGRRPSSGAPCQFQCARRAGERDGRGAF